MLKCKRKYSRTAPKAYSGTYGILKEVDEPFPDHADAHKVRFFGVRKRLVFSFLKWRIKK